LWNNHLIHHNSEEYNLAISIRQPFLNFINFLFFLSIPAAILGLPTTIIAIVFPIHKFAQVWYHTQQIGKLGFLEHIIVTPSQHRVHHAINPVYIDKNYSAIFNVWDRLFGTFQEELENEPPVYGITRPSQTYNPITINFEHIILLIKDAWRTENWIDKLTIWFRPTGWRPKGFEEKYPVKKITDPHNFEKYQPPATTGLRIWSAVQYLVLFSFVIYFLKNITDLKISGLSIFIIFVFVQVLSATELMNRNKWAPLFSVISTIVCLVIFFFDSSWFEVEQISTFLPLTFLAYFLLQTVMSFYFNRGE
jgi:hypothetical protein